MVYKTAGAEPLIMQPQIAMFINGRPAGWRAAVAVLALAATTLLTPVVEIGRAHV